MAMDPAERRRRGAEATRRYRARNPKAVRAAEKAWRDTHRPEINAAKRERRLIDPEATRQREAISRATRSLLNPHWQRDQNRRLRIEMIQAYGGCCACCGESQFEFLALDHIFGDGQDERRQFAGSTRLFYRLKRDGWPQGRHRILCHNCNMAMGFYGGCPHSRSAALKAG